MKILQTPDAGEAAGAPPAQQQLQQPPAAKVDKGRAKKMLARLGLKPDAEESEIFDAVEALLDNAEAAKAISARESEINKLVGASAGSLDRKRAEQVLANRASFAATQTKSKKK